MKKILLIMTIMAFLMVGAVAAQSFSYGVPDKARLGQQQGVETTAQDAYGEELTIRNYYQNESDQAEKAMAEANLRVEAQGAIPGLQNAYIHAENPAALERIEANMNRFQSRFQYRYENINATEVGNNTYLKAQRQARFLFFEFDIEDEYVLDEEGNLVAEQRGFLSRIFARERVN